MNGFVVPKINNCLFLTEGQMYEIVKTKKESFSCEESDVKIYFYDDMDDLIFMWLKASKRYFDVYFQIPYK